VIEGDITIDQALDVAGLRWSVRETEGVYGAIDGETIFDEDNKLLVRSDTKTKLACVSKDYSVIQNHEQAEFARFIQEEASGEVTVESAGSLWGGRKVWFLLRGASIWAGTAGRDETRTYMLVSNSHDRSMQFTVMPTSVRVVCQNTLHMSIAADSKRRLVTIRHEGDTKHKIEKAKQSLLQFVDARKRLEESAKALSARKMSRDEIQAFFVDVYQAIENEIPTDVEDAKTARIREESAEVIGKWSMNFDRERDIAGASAWNAMNAVTRWVDHQKSYRAAKGHSRDESRVNAVLFGKGADAKQVVLASALALV
jgi:phage/plasmid-like protein (TIGR03299 family)